jgi:electron transport complex protein RnfE
VLLGALRELLGTGALFANMELLFGPAAADWEITVINDYPNFLLAILPPGAFIFTGLIIAAKNLVDSNIKKRQASLKARPVKGAKRVRVTGNIS